jgi:hypothetical protein
VWTWGNETGSSWRMSNDIGFGDGEIPKASDHSEVIPADMQ